MLKQILKVTAGLALLSSIIVLSSIWLPSLFKVNYNDKYTIEHKTKKRVNIKFKDGTVVETDSRIYLFVTEFYDEAYKYDINVDSISKSYIGIFVEPLPKDTYGITTKSTNSFSIISEDILDSYNTVRLVVFHELAHKYLYPRNHCHMMCSEIFSANSNYNIYGRKWEDQKRILFTEHEHWGL